MKYTNTCQIESFDIIQGSKTKIFYSDEIDSETAHVVLSAYKIYTLDKKGKIKKLNKEAVVLSVSDIKKNSFMIEKMNVNERDKEEYIVLVHWILRGLCKNK